MHGRMSREGWEGFGLATFFSPMCFLIDCCCSRTCANTEKQPPDLAGHLYNFTSQYDKSQNPSITVKPLIKDTPKEDKPLNKGQTKCTIVYKLYKITSERGQPLYKGQNAGHGYQSMSTCRGSTVIQSTTSISRPPLCYSMVPRVTIIHCNSSISSNNGGVCPEPPTPGTLMFSNKKVDLPYSLLQKSW